ncbi:acyltransferase family protein [Streptomyces kaniharaensis]|uniref:Acyltransferase family protein n=1 Tax=Streptomyces kaniharaensis TaxID=212423 RepID=A0A6N7KZB6_9ACTN|nr:acyltransferase [Streptomyces kaniharaensis]MQS15608.1 acyltransferase family protein [Streptomyces kaniharaensis]
MGLTTDEDTIRLRVPAPRTPQSPPAPKAGGRDRYLDLLRALALIRVVVYHNFGWSWLPIIFPSMGVMFALAGALMARSLHRPALDVIRGRLRRLLPPMWLFGAVMLAGMVLDGWGPNSEGHPGWWWGKLAFWVLPLSTPPHPTTPLPGFHTLQTGWAEQAAVPLWYLRAYLWYVLLSPLMLRALRRHPWPTVLTPLMLCLIMNSGLFSTTGRIWETVGDFCTFGSCWLLGMAHQEGILKKPARYLVPSVAPLVMVAGLYWLLTRPFDPYTPTDMDDVPIAQALWSFGYVALLLHVSPSWEQWPRPLERWNGLVGLLNARAVSVYLWHTPALVLAIPLTDNLWSVSFLYQHARWLLTSPWLPLTAAIPLIGLLVLAFGWVEDLAAKRPLRLFPWPHRQKGKRRIPSR